MLRHKKKKRRRVPNEQYVSEADVSVERTWNFQGECRVERRR